MEFYKNLPDLPDYQTLVKDTNTSYTGIVNLSDNFKELRKKVRHKALSLYKLDNKITAEALEPPETYSFDRYTLTDLSVISYLEKELNLTKSSARIQVLMPGNLTMEHIDDLDAGYITPVEENLRTNNFTPAELDRFKNDPYSVRRFLVMLDDWRPGQGIMFGANVFTNWKKGDAITWDWKNEVHSTFNTGFWARPLIRITGFTND